MWRNKNQIKYILKNLGHGEWPLHDEIIATWHGDIVKYFRAIREQLIQRRSEGESECVFRDVCYWGEGLDTALYSVCSSSHTLGPLHWATVKHQSCRLGSPKDSVVPHGCHFLCILTQRWGQRAPLRVLTPFLTSWPSLRTPPHIHTHRTITLEIKFQHISLGKMQMLKTQYPWSMNQLRRLGD